MLLSWKPNITSQLFTSTAEGDQQREISGRDQQERSAGEISRGDQQREISRGGNKYTENEK